MVETVTDEPVEPVEEMGTVVRGVEPIMNVTEPVIADPRLAVGTLTVAVRIAL